MTPARNLIAYRHTHEQTNVAVVVLTALAELGIQPFDPEKRGQELVLHGLIQRGVYVEGRGLLLLNALRYLFDRGVHWQVLLDAKRTAALQERVRQTNPAFEFQLVTDLGAPVARPLSIEADLDAQSLVLLVEARHALGRLPLHVLLARRDGAEFAVMNSETGENHRCSAGQLSDHLNTPVHFGAVAFAGRHYLYTGVAIRLNQSGK
jgi:hypothetical protein